MADTAHQLVTVVERLRARGHTVIPVDGWSLRGKGPMTTRGRCERGRLHTYVRVPRRSANCPGRGHPRVDGGNVMKATCSIDGCDKPSSRRGWCVMHYTRERRYGDPTTTHRPMERGKSVEQRFWAKVNKSEDCWIWTASVFTDRMGYGKFQAGTSRDESHVVRAHRFAWELEHGPIPPGMDVLHACDNPPCVRVDHLRLGSRAENNDDMARKLRQGNAKLDPEAVRQIRSSTETNLALAARLGVSKATVWAARHRRTWRHVA